MVEQVREGSIVLTQSALNHSENDVDGQMEREQNIYSISCSAEDQPSAQKPSRLVSWHLPGPYSAEQMCHPTW